MALFPSSISRSPALASEPTGVYVGLGSNLGYKNVTPRQLVERTLVLIEEDGDQVIATSALWTSHAWPANTGASDYVNAVCRLWPFDNDPAALLTRLNKIEAKLGRKRDPQNQWASRTIDIDILDYNGAILENDSFLKLPHPRIAVRDFVLFPLLEVCPNWVHPITGLPGARLLDDLKQVSGAISAKKIEGTVKT
jgi:2-amino-4-hydroxy-6-hydroxymethyldihydropteridine diphosphokinase